MTTALEIADWRREIHRLYATVRSYPDPEHAHRAWRERRNELFAHHPQSPLQPGDALQKTGLPYFPYDLALRFNVPLNPELNPEDGPVRTVTSANDGEITMRRIGTVTIPHPVDTTLDVWWLVQYGGGIFLPVRDGTAGIDSYGGGRYLLDTAKGADLGGEENKLVLDFNFLYHPSCRYNPFWECPLAPEGNTVTRPIYAGERL